MTRRGFEAPGFVSGLNDLAMMGETVEQRCRHLGVAEDGGPFAERQVGGDDDRGALVKPADQMEEQLAAGLGEGQNERLRCIQLQRFKTFDQPVRPASPVHARLRSPCPGCRLRHADS
jgi:hypothetical protein